MIPEYVVNSHIVLQSAETPLVATLLLAPDSHATKVYSYWLDATNRSHHPKICCLSSQGTSIPPPSSWKQGNSPAALTDLLDVLRKNKRKLRVDPSSRTFQEALAREHTASLGKLLPLKARLAFTDRLIDRIVYRLYGLTEEEIAIVEA